MDALRMIAVWVNLSISKENAYVLLKSNLYTLHTMNDLEKLINFANSKKKLTSTFLSIFLLCQVYIYCYCHGNALLNFMCFKTALHSRKIQCDHSG